MNSSQRRRLVSGNICSVDVNSAGIFISKVLPIIFEIREKWMPIIFDEDQTAIFGEIKAELPFSEGKYQLLKSWNKIPFPKILYHLNFQLAHSNRSNSVFAHKSPLKRP